MGFESPDNNVSAQNPELGSQSLNHIDGPFTPALEKTTQDEVLTTQDEVFWKNREMKFARLPEIKEGLFKRRSAITKITAKDAQAIEISENIFADENRQDAFEISGMVEIPPVLKETISDVLKILPRYCMTKGLKEPVFFNPERVVCIDATQTTEEGLRALFLPESIDKPENVDESESKNPKQVRKARGIWSPGNNTFVIDGKLISKPLEFFNVLVHEAVHMLSHNHNTVNVFDTEHKRISFSNSRSGVAVFSDKDDEIKFNALNEVMVEGFTQNFIAEYWDIFPMLKVEMAKEIELCRQSMETGDLKEKGIDCLRIEPYGIVIGNVESTANPHTKSFSSNLYRQYDRAYLAKLKVLAETHGVSRAQLFNDMINELRDAFFNGSSLPLFRKLKKYGISPQEFKEMDDDVVRSVESEK